MDFRLLYESFIRSLTLRRVFAILFAVGFVVYMNSFVNDLFWDDYDSIVNNQYVRNFDLPDFFTKNLTAGAGITDNYWRPLLLISFATDYAIGGVEPFFYHFQNFAWHLGASLLVFLVGIRLFPKRKTASLIASLLFLVHPLQTEAVTYAAGRADPMHTALMLGSIYFFLRHIGSGKYPALLWSLLLFVLALLTKERAIVLPIILVLCLFLVPIEGAVRGWKRKFPLLSPYVAIAGIYAVSRATFLHFADTFDPGTTTILQNTTLWQKILVFLAGIGTYGKLIVWPDHLYMEKTLPLPSSFFDPMVLFGISILVLTAFLVLASLKRKKLVAFCLLGFFATLLPSMYVYPVQGLLYEHWLYPAFPWLFLGIGLGLSDYLDGTKRIGRIPSFVPATALALILIALGVRTIARNLDWQTPVRFYEKNVAEGGVSGRVYTNLGMAYDDAHQPEKAVPAYRLAIDASGDTLFQPWFDLGNTLSKLGKTDEAIDAYHHAILLNPNFTPTSTNLAKIFVDRRDNATAIAILDEALRTHPDDLSLLFAQAAISVNAGDTATAETYAQKILAIDPNNQQAQQIFSFIRSRPASVK
ncbi:MAG: tetratricopeptide repeat protein [Candidatus Moraniibacteriota bacterium]